MDAPEKDLAVNIAYQADDPVGALILRQAEERLRALQMAAHSLDQRMTQVAALQFAAAGFASQAATGSVPWLVWPSAISFLIGALVAFRGIRSDPIHLPGIAPSWWKESLTVTPFGLDLATGWAAGVYENAIAQVDVENCERGRSLNLSLRYALGGAVLMMASAAIKSLS